MTDTEPRDPPSPFIATWATRLASAFDHPRRALDVAMGRGRHALVLAAAGFQVFGVDIKPDAVRDGVVRAAEHGLRVRGWCADLTRSSLPPDRFELIVVTRYLQRDLAGALTNALKPGGILLFETFTEGQRTRRRGPTSPDHLLKPGELTQLFPDLETLFYEEVTDPEADAVARLAARRRSRPS